MAPRGTELSVTLPAEEFAAMAAATERPPAGTPDSEGMTRQALMRLTAQPSLRGGQIAANSRSELGGGVARPYWCGSTTTSATADVTSVRPGWHAPAGSATMLALTDAPALRKRVSEMMADVTETDRRSRTLS